MLSSKKPSRTARQQWMSFADYDQQAEDHRCILVIIKRVGQQMSTRHFNHIVERITAVSCIPIEGQRRHVFLRYLQRYPLENNEWGDFQAHRRVLGLICLGRATEEKDIKALQREHEDLKVNYENTLFDSRLVVFGLDNDGCSLPVGLQRMVSNEMPDTEDTNDDILNALVKSSLDTNETQSTSEDENKGEKKKSDPNHNKNVNKSSLAKEKPRSIHNDPLNVSNLLHGENGNLVPPEDGRKPSRAQPPKESKLPNIYFYPTSKDSEGLEGMVRDFALALFWVIESKRLDRSQERQDKLPLLMTPFEKKDFVGIDTENRVYRKRCTGRLRKHLGDLCLQAGLPAEALLHYQTAADILKAANDWLWFAAAVEGICSASVILMNPAPEKQVFSRNRSFSVRRGSTALNECKLAKHGEAYPNGLDLADSRQKTVLPEDVIEKYKDAILHYEKFKNAGIIEIEACLKACKVLIGQGKYLLASEFLQNVVYINPQLSENEKIERFNTLSSLYGRLGMSRKSSFFKRVAAMQAVAPQNTSPNWQMCYLMLLEALKGFKLSLNPKEVPHGIPYGWPLVQSRVMQELIYSARRLGDPAIVIRHFSLAFHILFDHQSEEETMEMARVLETYTDKVAGTAYSLRLNDGIILPPVPMMRFPTVKSFTLQPLPPHLRPERLKVAPKEADSGSPFIYSPLMTSSQRNKQTDIHWVEGDVCETSLQVYNPMPIELKVSNITILVEGEGFESFPVSLSLPAASGPFPVKIIGVPKKAGQLTVIGYTTKVLGVNSHCRMQYIPWLEADRLLVSVVSALPLLQVTTSLPKANSFSSLADSESVVTSATTVLYAGESCVCQVTLVNESKQPVDMIQVALDSRTQADVLDEVISWDMDSILSQLPMPPGGELTFKLQLNGFSDFLAPKQPEIPMGARAKAAVPVVDDESADSLLIEALLKLRYSGGPGLKSGHCRQCAVAVTIEIQPSVIFKAWDVLPGLNNDMCNMLLDVENPSSSRILLHTGTNEPIPVASKQTTRFPLAQKRLEFPEYPGVAAEPRSKYMMGVQVTQLDLKAKYLAQHLDVTWEMPSSGKHGRLSLEKVRWTKEQLDIISVSLLSWEIKVNGKKANNELIKATAGESLLIELSVKNSTGHNLESAQIELPCFLDLETGYRNYDLSDMILFSGSNVELPKKVPVGDSLDFQISYVFLCGGTFNLEPRLSALDCKPSNQQDLPQTTVVSKEQDEFDARARRSWTYSPCLVVQVVGA